MDQQRGQIRYGLGVIDGVPVALGSPRTYMNASGSAVAPLVRFYRVPLDELLVVYDDLDLPLGSLRLRPQGGSGGHKGMKSIIQHLGGRTDFPRLRIGIGRPPGKMDPAAYVLQDFGPEERALVRDSLARAADAVRLWIGAGIERAMNEVN